MLRDISFRLRPAKLAGKPHRFRRDIRRPGGGLPQSVVEMGVEVENVSPFSESLSASLSTSTDWITSCEVSIVEGFPNSAALGGFPLSTFSRPPLGSPSHVTDPGHNALVCSLGVSTPGLQGRHP